jgi:hypothetical protein
MVLPLIFHSKFYAELGATEKVKFSFRNIESLKGGVIFFSAFLHALHNQRFNHPIGFRQSEVLYFSGPSVLRVLNPILNLLNNIFIGDDMSSLV